MSRKNNKEKRRGYQALRQTRSDALEKKIADKFALKGELAKTEGQIVDLSESEGDWEDVDAAGEEAMAVEAAPRRKKIKKKDKLLQRRVIQLEKKRLRKMNNAPILKFNKTATGMDREM